MSYKIFTNFSIGFYYNMVPTKKVGEKYVGFLQCMDTETTGSCKMFLNLVIMDENKVDDWFLTGLAPPS